MSSDLRIDWTTAEVHAHSRGLRLEVVMRGRRDEDWVVAFADLAAQRHARDLLEVGHCPSREPDEYVLSLEAVTEGSVERDRDRLEALVDDVNVSAARRRDAGRRSVTRMGRINERETRLANELTRRFRAV